MRLTAIRSVVAMIAAMAYSATASAQYSPQMAIPPIPGQSPAFVMSAPAPQPVKVYKHNGHLATATRNLVSQSTGQYWCSNCPNGQNCNNGAGSFSSDLGFFFGPSKSFFAPCGPRVLPDCGGRGCQKCRSPIYGTGPAGPWPFCTYDSYLNH